MGDLLCAIHQPNFFPRLSTLAKLFTADIWVVLDDVQFARRDYQHRCRVTGPDGTELWLTVPVHLSAGRDTLIQDVIVADPDHASARVSSIIRRDYRHSRYWPDVRDQVPQVQEVFAHSDRLTEISEASTLALLRALGWTGAVYRSSELMARPGRSQHLADLPLPLVPALTCAGPEEHATSTPRRSTLAASAWPGSGRQTVQAARPRETGRPRSAPWRRPGPEH
jgi:WbqC-like protein family